MHFNQRSEFIDIIDGLTKARKAIGIDTQAETKHKMAVLLNKAVVLLVQDDKDCGEHCISNDVSPIPTTG